MDIKQKLKSADEEVRLHALREMPRSDAADYLQAVFSSLGDESWRVRKEAVALYLSLPVSGELAGQVIEFLHAEENAGLRNAAFEILVKLGRLSIPFLLEEINCADHDVRKFVLDILGEIADESTVPAMIDKLSDPDENVRAAAAENLGKLRARSAVAPLMTALQSENLLFRFTILEALSQIGSPISSSQLIPLYDNPLLRKPLFDCLGRVGGTDASSLLISGLSDSMRNVRISAVQALLRLVERHSVPETESIFAELRASTAIDSLISMLDSSGEAVRVAAVKLLGYAQDPRSTKALLELFDDDSLRDDAAKALIAAGAKSVCALLPLWSKINPQAQIYLAYVFAETGCCDAAGVLASSLAKGDVQLRTVVLHALGRLGGPAETTQICDYLGDESTGVRNAACEALVNIGRRFPESLHNIIIPMASDGQADVRTTVISVLGRLGGSQIDSILMMGIKDEAPQVRRTAVRYLNAGNVEHRQALFLALNDEESDVRRQAAEALGNSSATESLQALALALGDDDIWVRSAAVRALGRIQCPLSLEYLRRGLRDPVGMVVITTLDVLSEIDSKGVKNALIDALSHPDDEVVVAALQHLSRLNETDWLHDWAERLLNHRYWDVRLSASRLLAERFGQECRQTLEARLLIEGEEMVRDQLRAILESFAPSRGRV